MARARLLDLTRSLRRADRGATGVDRVEQAYLARFINDDTPCFALARTPLGYLLLDRTGMAAFQERLLGHMAWGKAGVLSHFGKGRSAVQKQAESDLRRSAIARATRGRLPLILAEHMKDGFDYFNVGHSNLTERVFNAIKSAGGQSHVLIHDVIPLTHPQFQRSTSVDRFSAKMQQVGTHADRVIYNSQDTRKNAQAHMCPAPACIVAHLGTVAPQPSMAGMPEGVPPRAPYFVSVGTIEPRKNHGFLLDLWEQLGPDAPGLLICGARGWNNETVFERLDALPPDSPIQELPNLSDANLAMLVQSSAGLLFPSHVEGFGLPPLEALTLGTRVLCNDLPVLREFLHEKPFYAAVSDPILWQSTIKKWAANPLDVQHSEPFSGPTWDDHFKIVLRLS